MQQRRPMGMLAKVAIGIGATLVGLFILGAFLAPARNRDATATANALAAIASATPGEFVPPATSGPAGAAIGNTATPPPSATPKPTNTPAPTRTPRPTSTPKPTAPPTEIPTPTTPPEPITLSGSGQDVTDPVFVPFPLARVTLAHDGSRNFIVTVFSGDDEDYLTNVIGRYSGSRLIQGDRETYFEVNADGGWMIHIEPLGFDDTLSAGASGSGDTITDLFEPSKVGAVPYKFTHDGSRNFIVQILCAGGADYVQNEIGAVDGAAVVKFSDGPCLWDVRADGNWTLAPK